MAYDEAERLTRGRSDGERKDVRLIAGAIARALLRQPEIELPSENVSNDSGLELLDSSPDEMGETASRRAKD